jgi:hypothetical protein
MGVRVVWLQTTGLPEALSGDVFPDYGTGLGRNMTREEFVPWLQKQTMLGRLTSLAEVGMAAAFLASDWAGAMTATGVNLSAGSVLG